MTDSTSQPVILSACRTAIGTFGGALKEVPAPVLGAIVAREALRRAGVHDEVDETIMGCVLQAGLGMNPARQASIGAGLPDSVPAHTVNKVCGSGLKAVMLAAQAIQAGDARLVLAGGMENMSRAPFLLPGARWGERLGHGQVQDHMLHEGLTDAFHDIHMGITAENLVERFAISREDQDAFAAESQARAAAAIREGRFKDEIVAVPVPAEEGRSPGLRSGRAPPRRRDPRVAGPAQARVQEGRQRDRRQRERAQRRRGRARGGERLTGEGAGASIPAPASWPMPRPASTRRSWASAPCPRCAGPSRRRASRPRTSISTS